MTRSMFLVSEERSFFFVSLYRCNLDFTGCLRKKYNVADYRYFKNGSIYNNAIYLDKLLRYVHSLLHLRCGKEVNFRCSALH